jgi:hypothetical protein
MKVFTNTVTSFTAELRHDPFFKWALRINLATQILCLAIMPFVWQKLPPVIPFHYSVPWGEEQLMPPVSLIVLIGVSFLLFVINTLIALFLFGKSSYLSHMLLSGTTAVTLFIAFSIVQTVLLVT